MLPKLWYFTQYNKYILNKYTINTINIKQFYLQIKSDHYNNPSSSKSAPMQYAPEFITSKDNPV